MTISSIAHSITNEISKAIDVITQNKAIIIPTDTLPGLACNIMNASACEKIYSIKQRPQNKPLAVFVPNVEWIFNNCITDANIMDFCTKNLPGAYTLLLKLKDKTLANSMRHGGITNEIIGVRIPNNTFCLTLTDQLQKMHGNNVILCATSVNLSNTPPATTIAQIDVNIIDQVSYVGKQFQASSEKPSTIIDFTSSSAGPTIVR